MHVSERGNNGNTKKNGTDRNEPGGVISVSKRNSDQSLSVRAAWLHYAGGFTQTEVARRLGVTHGKAHRLINRANQEGTVKVFIDGDIAECVALEVQLAERFGLDTCEVGADLNDSTQSFRSLGIAGAGFLYREIKGGTRSLIGVGHGRTLAACVEQMPRLDAGNTRFVSLLGGLTRKYAANPHDVIHRLAEKTGAEAYVMPVPFFANSAEDREVLLAQSGIRDVFDLAARSDLKLVGIGTSEPDASLVSTSMIKPEEIYAAKEQGCVSEMLGHFFDADGNSVQTDLTSRTTSLGLDALRNSRIVAVAGGKIKTCAIRSILMSRLLSGLITDERTASSLLHDQES